MSDKPETATEKAARMKALEARIYTNRLIRAVLTAYREAGPK